MAEPTAGSGIVDGIDLYADVDNDFQAEELAANESGDLYDDVLTSNVGNEDDKTPTKQAQEIPNNANASPLVSPTHSGPGVGLINVFPIRVCKITNILHSSANV